MIVPMSKVYIVTQKHQRDQLLEALGKLSVVHIEPIDPQKAIADKAITNHLDEVNKALRILETITPQGAAIQAGPEHIVRETILIHKTLVEDREQLSVLHRLADQLTVWGDLEVKELEALRDADVAIQFFVVPEKTVPELKAEYSEVVGEKSGQMVVAIIDRTGKFAAPEGAQPLAWPSRDLPSIKKEAANLDGSIKQNSDHLTALAFACPQLIQYRNQQAHSAAFCVAQHSGLSYSSLFALQGWVPSAKAEQLGDELAEQSISAAVDIVALEEEDVPPTLIEYPKWVKPIKALFDMLGTLPGYDEVDLSPFFMIALPIFTAMLIGDGGYGLLLAGAGLAFYRPLAKVAGKPAANLLIIFGLATLVYGTLTATFFGMNPATLTAAGFEDLGKTLASFAPFYREDGEASRALIMKLSLIIGCIHLILAHVRRFIQFWPDSRAYAEAAWSVILGAMMALIYYVMFVGIDAIPSVVGIIILVGLGGVCWFSEPHTNPIKRVLTGFASAILPLLNTFSDTMSYIRLFAVGLSSFYIADAFNGLGAQVASGSSWLLGAPIVIFGHALNLGLAAIAIFAHGVRLNMLEFSNNVGVKWAGHAYLPFTKNTRTSIGERKL